MPYRLIPGFVLGLLSPQAELRDCARAFLSTEVTAALSLPAPVQPAGDTQPRASGLSSPIDKQLPFARLFVAKGFGASAGVCDLVVHFHGAPETTIPAFDSTGIPAALLLVNLGVWADPYVDAYAQSTAFPRLIAAVQKALSRVLPDHEQCTIGRIALSAFSSGYAAVSRILLSTENIERIDAVLLADAMHAPYLDKLTRQVDARGMTGITRFARLATEGERMLSITHSSIETYAFASTSRTASALLSTLGVVPVVRALPGPRQMTMKYRADRRGLHVRGFEGSDAPAHSDHLRAIGQTLFPELRDRWADRL